MRNFEMHCNKEKREKDSTKGRECAHLEMHYNRKERNKASTPRRKKKSFNNRERKRGLAQGREKVMATKKEKDFQ